MRCLIVEDDMTARMLMQNYLGNNFDCDIAADGNEAIEKFTAQLEKNAPYDLICLDIMMPQTSGHEALLKIRQVEGKHGIGGLDRVKVIMTTALSDSKNVFGAFNEGCEAYIIKPVSKAKLYQQIEKLGLTVTI